MIEEIPDGKGETTENKMPFKLDNRYDSESNIDEEFQRVEKTNEDEEIMISDFLISIPVDE